ncbi:ABC transporter ATP-binding protein [Actinomadura fibrosa]|uniref:ABC transporter ATP-binding protein n=1 Tax=Actinomadura fibrosa TaxID=111802 RepID=A0ABW2XUJ7_9ACTN|nr:ABC transporter ATP-binding protein [Actinomadura fibrosa]
MIAAARRVFAGHERGLLVQLLAVFAFAVLQGLTFVLAIPVLRRLLDGDTEAMWPWAGALAAVAAATLAAFYVQSMVSFRLGIRLISVLHHRIGDHLARLPIGWFDAARVGTLSQDVSQGVKDSAGTVAHLVQPIVTAVVTPLTVAVAITVLNPVLGAVTLALAPLLYLGYRVSVGWIARSDEAADEAAARQTDRVVEFAEAQGVLRSAGRVRNENGLLDRALAEHHRTAARRLRGGAPGRALFAAVTVAALAVLLAVGAVQVTADAGRGAEVIVLLVLAVRFLEPISSLAQIGATVRHHAGALRRLEELLATPPLPEPETGAEPAHTGIRLRGVEFGYRPGEPVLRGMDLTVPPGTMTAIVGPSGAGKSTVIRLIARFYDVDAGSVSVGDADVRDLTTPTLMDRLALVFQDVYLFDGTLADNIRAGRPDVPDAEFAAAVAAAQVDSIADRLPDGLATRVGEGGHALSGGERQRVALARALVKDAPILLLDEATSALDPANAAAITRALALQEGRTRIVVAHQLETIAHADQIAFVDGGRVVESGTHDELLAADGRYARFWAESRSSHAPGDDVPAAKDAVGDHAGG